jgi:hypothetical protein
MLIGRSTKNFIIFVLGFCFLGQIKVFASEAHLQLFNDKGKFVYNYASKLEKLAYELENSEKQVRLDFSHDTSIVVDKLLGQGGAHYVFRIADSNQVLRLRKFKYKPIVFFSFNPFVSIDTFYEIESGYKELSEAGVKLPKMYDPGKNRGQFLIHEFVDFQYDYYDYLKTEIPTETRKKMDLALIEFAKATSVFRKIGDFKSDQLVFSNKGEWVLLDYSQGTERAFSEQDGNIFVRDERDKARLRALSYANGTIIEPIERKPGLPEYIKKEVLEHIYKTRLDRRLSCKKAF